MRGGRYRGSSRQGPPPRNYFTWNKPFDPKEPPTASGEPIPTHDRLDPNLLTGILELNIELLSPVYVGSGNYDDETGQPRKMPIMSCDRLVIPGSSIKGICRLTFEALTNSLSPWNEPQVALLEARSHYQSRSRLTSEGRKFNERVKKAAQHQQERTGFASSVFGSFGCLGRVSFDDALAPESTEPCAIKVSVAYPPAGKLSWLELRDPRKRIKQLPGAKRLGRRFYGRQKPEARQPKTIPVLALPSALDLTTTLRFRNLHEYELGLVLQALGLQDKFTPKLGGAKYDHGIGWVRFRANRYRLRTRFGCNEPWVDGRDETQDFCNTCIQQTARHLDDDGKEFLDKLSQEMRVPRDEIGGGQCT